MGILIVMLVGLIGCDLSSPDSPRNGDLSSPEISFDDSDTLLTLSEGELFDLPINISKFSMSALKRKYPYPISLSGGSSSLILDVQIDHTGSDPDSSIDASVYEEFRTGSCGIGEYGTYSYVDDGDSKAKFSSLYVDRYERDGIQKCNGDCVLTVRLFFRSGCGGGGACDDNTISTIKRPIKINSTSHALEIAKISATKAKITATKDGSPLANTELKIKATQRRWGSLHYSPDDSCSDYTVYDRNKPVTTGIDGTKEITLAPTSDWDSNVKINACDASFAITVDGYHFKGKRASNCD